VKPLVHDLDQLVDQVAIRRDAALERITPMEPFVSPTSELGGEVRLAQSDGSSFLEGQTLASEQRIARSGTVLARLSLKQGQVTYRLSLAVGASTPITSVWTSFNGLRCGTGDQAQLLAPNFSSEPTATTIDVRPWLAWYTSTTGWQWLGTAGPSASAWYRWTATPTGVAEWQQSGTVTPWSWAPVSITPGHDTYLVAVFEAIYWYSNPTYVWQNARSGPNAQTISTYCVYP
jgi:hypothetical protein